MDFFQHLSPPYSFLLLGAHVYCFLSLKHSPPLFTDNPLLTFQFKRYVFSWTPERVGALVIYAFNILSNFWPASHIYNYVLISCFVIRILASQCYGHWGSWDPQDRIWEETLEKFPDRFYKLMLKQKGSSTEESKVLWTDLRAGSVCLLL